MEKNKITVTLNKEEYAQLQQYRLHIASKEKRIVSKQEVLKTALEPYLSIGRAIGISEGSDISDEN